MRRVTTVLVLMTVVATISTRQARAENLIHVEVVSLHNSTGQVACTIFPSASGFPSDRSKAVGGSLVPIKDKKAVCDFGGLPSGQYAVAVIHDENSNGKLEYNDMGIPSEGVGASRDAKGAMGPPKFDDAKFDYPGGRKDLTVHMDYLLEHK